MKTLRRLTLSLAFAGIALAAQAQTADEVVNKYVAAYGGAEKFKSIQSQHAEGVMSLQGMEVPLKVITAHKKGVRVEFEVMATKNITVMTTAGGWTMMPISGQTAPVDADAEALKEGMRDLDLTGELFDYKTKGNKVELAGKETLEGQELYKLKLTHADGSTVDYYLDASTYYLTKRVTKKPIEGQEVEVTELFSDYKKTPEGFVYAAIMEQQPMGMKMNFTKVQVNVPVDEKIFEKPKP